MSDDKIAEIRARHSRDDRWRNLPSMICPQAHDDRALLLAEIERLNKDLATQQGCCDGAAAQDAHIRREREEHRAEVDRQRAEIERLRNENARLRADVPVYSSEIQKLLAENDRHRKELEKLKIERDRARGELNLLTRDLPALPHQTAAGCVCPAGANLSCQNSFCPRRNPPGVTCQGGKP